MTAAKRSARSSRVFFEFRYGAEKDPQYYRIVNDNEPRWLGNKPYDPLSVAHVVLPEQTIALNEREAQVQIPFVADTFADLQSRPGKHSPIDLLIFEQQRLQNGVYADDTKTLYEGRVSRSLRHMNGQSRVVTFFLLGEKSDLQSPLGIPVNHHCWAAFGGNGCFFPIINLRETATTSNIRQNRITISGLPTGKAAGYWKFGWIEAEGIQLEIADWEGESGAHGGTEFTLRDAAGPEFDGNVNVHVFPGCAKTYQACNAHGNILNFGGWGIGVADYDPRYEVRV